MPDQTVVDLLYQDFQELMGKIDIAEVSLQTTLRITFSKSLWIAAASYFEDQVKKQILDFVRQASSGHRLVYELARVKVVERQYHTLFNWSSNNANEFFSCFGEEFKHAMQQYVKDNEDYRDSIKEFMEIGRVRNSLVHQNYAQFPLEKTVDEIYASYRTGLLFVNSISNHLERVTNSDEIVAQVGGA